LNLLESPFVKLDAHNNSKVILFHEAKKMGLCVREIERWRDGEKEREKFSFLWLGIYAHDC